MNGARRRSHTRHGRIAIGFFSIVAAAHPALGAPCGRPDLQATFPADGATQVPLDASLSAVYAATADYLGEAVELSTSDRTLTLDAQFDPGERRLFAQPSLQPETSYTLHWPELRGLSSAGHGVGKTISFVTSTENDTGTPEFAGIQRIDWDLVQTRDDCTDDLEQRFRFTFSIGSASDDAGPRSLALLLFQTQGQATESGAPRLLSVQAFPSNGQTRLDLAVDEAMGRVCFAAVARDLVGRVSSTGSDEHCVKTTAPPFFYGCQSRPGAPGSASMLALAIGAALAVRRRRGRRAM